MVIKNGLYKIKMGNLFHSLLATPTIPMIKIVDLWLSNLMANKISG
jgi:hypothetical protein